MLETIHRFIAALRREGLRISPAEAIDAARAVRAVGVEKRDAVRCALSATLAKSRDDAATLDRLFARYFAAGPAPRKGKGKRRGEPAGPPEGAGGRRAPSPEPRRQADLSSEPDRGPKRARPGRLKVILTPRRARQDDRVRRAAAPPSRPAPRVRPRPPARRAPARPEQPRQGAPGPAGIRRLDLRLPLTSVDEEMLAREVPRLIKEIRLRAGRRRRRSRRGSLWPARLMRDSLATGGVPFALPRRAPRPRRPRVVVLVDVSWSVLRASALFLFMARAFLKPGARTAIWLFVDRCVDATVRLASWKDGKTDGWERFLASIPGLDPNAPSDYGRAFHQAARAAARGMASSRRDTVLVVLGDARNNFGDPQAWAFEDLAARCRRVIWLDPEPSPLWDTGDSTLAEYLPSCDVVCEANDLEGIARGVAEMVRSL